MMLVENSPDEDNDKTITMSLQQPLYLVSFPRSGHTLITKIVEEIFIQHNLPYTYCESYINTDERDLVCGPNSNPNVLKSHDFDLTLNVDSNSKYVVLYRSELRYQLEAVFRWLCTKHRGCPKSMRSFMDNWSSYYVLFKNKWLDRSYFDGRRVAALEYYQFLAEPNFAIEKFLEHLEYKYDDGSEFIWDGDIIAAVVKSFDVRLQQNEEEVSKRVAENGRRYEVEGGTRLLDNDNQTPLWEGFFEL